MTTSCFTASSIDGFIADPEHSLSWLLSRDVDPLGPMGYEAFVATVDDIWVQCAPVALGAGAPLLPRRLELRLEETVRNRDFACARYAVVRPQPDRA